MHLAVHLDLRSDESFIAFCAFDHDVIAFLVEMVRQFVATVQVLAGFATFGGADKIHSFAI